MLIPTGATVKQSPFDLGYIVTTYPDFFSFFFYMIVCGGMGYFIGGLAVKDSFDSDGRKKSFHNIGLFFGFFVALVLWRALPLTVLSDKGGAFVFGLIGLLTGFFTYGVLSKGSMSEHKGGAAAVAFIIGLGIYAVLYNYIGKVSSDPIAHVFSAFTIPISAFVVFFLFYIAIKNFSNSRNSDSPSKDPSTRKKTTLPKLSGNIEKDKNKLMEYINKIKKDWEDIFNSYEELLNNLIERINSTNLTDNIKNQKKTECLDLLKLLETLKTKFIEKINVFVNSINSVVSIDDVNTINQELSKSNFDGFLREHIYDSNTSILKQIRKIEQELSSDKTGKKDSDVLAKITFSKNFEAINVICINIKVLCQRVESGFSDLNELKHDLIQHLNAFIGFYTRNDFLNRKNRVWARYYRLLVYKTSSIEELKLICEKGIKQDITNFWSKLENSDRSDKTISNSEIEIIRRYDFSKKTPESTEIIYKYFDRISRICDKITNLKSGSNFKILGNYLDAELISLQSFFKENNGKYKYQFKWITKIIKTRSIISLAELKIFCKNLKKEIQKKIGDLK